MKNLAKKLIPLVLVGTILGGCATYSNMPKISANGVAKPDTSHMISLGHRRFARNYKVSDNLDLITSARLGEVILKKEENGEYTKIKTRTYGTSSENNWNTEFNYVCISADYNSDGILEEDETQRLLDMTYDNIEEDNKQKALNKMWIKDDGGEEE